MASDRRPEDASLLDVLIDGFEKNDVLLGFHFRKLPLPDEVTAVLKFSALTAEARRWKGPPHRTEEHPRRRLAAWPDLQVRQAGRGILLLVRAPWFGSWWIRSATWAGEPMDEAFDWLEEEVMPKPSA